MCKRKSRHSYKKRKYFKIKKEKWEKYFSEKYFNFCGRKIFIFSVEEEWEYSCDECIPRITVDLGDAFLEAVYPWHRWWDNWAKVDSEFLQYFEHFEYSSHTGPTTSEALKNNLDDENIYILNE